MVTQSSGMLELAGPPLPFSLTMLFPARAPRGFFVARHPTREKDIRMTIDTDLETRPHAGLETKSGIPGEASSPMTT